MKSSLEHRLPIKTISLTILLGLGGYWALVWALTDWAQVWRLVQGLSWVVWWQLMGLALLSYGMRFARWHLLIRALGHRVALGPHLLIYLSAFALAFTPAKMGETIRSIYLRPWGVTYPQSLAAFVVERLIDLLVVAALASLVVGVFREHSAWLAMAGLLTVVLVTLFRSQLLVWLSTRWFKGPLAQHASQGLQCMAQLLSVTCLASVAPLTALAWLAQGLGLGLVCAALGHDLPWHWVVGIYSLSLLAGAASFVPGGLGTTEAAMVLLLMAAGLDLATATSAALIARGVPLWLALALGVLSLLRLSTGKHQ